jgi:5-methylcytosine-specific restriction enzyme A
VCSLPRSRRQAWLRDELILALDLYLRSGVNASREERQELSDVLRSIPVELELADDPSFRSRASVSYKLGNFDAINPATSAAGFEHVGSQDAEVWEELAGDPTSVAEAAAAIRANLGALGRAEAEEDEPEVSDAPEGTILTRLHRVRERSGKLVAAKKKRVREERGKLACEACGFDFAAVYGIHGDGFIECHHTQPLHTLRPGQRTKFDDLTLVCSNCHRMIHRKEWLSIGELRNLITP